MTIPLEIERKFIIAMPDIERLSRQAEYTCSKIVQTYLSSPPSVTHRVRKRITDRETVYTETKKIRIDEISSYEDEREISKTEYEILVCNIADGSKPVLKTRHTFEFDEHTIEIDIYPEWKKTAIMEIELPSRDTTLSIPPFISIVREVSGIKEYANAAMARCFPNESDFKE